MSRMSRARARNRRKNTNSVIKAEMWDILPTYGIVAGLILIVCIIISIVGRSFDFRLYLGILVGCGVSIANFYFMGATAESITREVRTEKKAKFNANASYGLRYIGIFVIFAAFLVFDLINMATALIPLFVPRIHYTFKYGFKKP